jgi:hypothetical protein
LRRLAKANNDRILEQSADHVAVGERCGVTEHWLSNDGGMLRKRGGKALDEFPQETSSLTRKMRR